MTISQLSDIMKKHGLVGAGGAGFPSYAKLSEKADTIILNCAECEPLLRLHRQLLEKFTYEILTSLKAVSEAVGAKRVYIAVKETYKNTVEAVKAHIGEFPGMEIALLPNVYPSGDEIVLSYEVTGRIVPPGSIPITRGIIVYNVETMLNLYYALNEKSVTHKYVTVMGEVESPVTVRVPLGMSIDKLVSLAGGVTSDDVTYISGGPMMGNIISRYDAVTKTTNAILVLKESSIVVQRKKQKTTISMKRAMSSCCQCQMCTDLCPRHMLGHPIEPNMFMRAASSGQVQSIKPLVNTMYCSSCGVCELYACPQGLSPRTLITEYKTKLRENGIKAAFDDVCTANSARDKRTVPMKRLIARLGLSKYNGSAPIRDIAVKSDIVKVMLSQSIGEKCVAAVKTGDSVKQGDIIADVSSDKLGVPLHAPVDGRIEKITDKYILIKENN